MMVATVSDQYSKLQNAFELEPFECDTLLCVNVCLGKSAIYTINFTPNVFFIKISYKSHTLQLLYNSETYQEHQIINYWLDMHSRQQKGSENWTW